MIILYFYDNFIQYKEKEEINEIAFPEEALDYGKIKNISLFETYLEKLARQKKWLTLFKAKKLILVVHIHYSEYDKEVLTVILQNIGFQNISFKKEEQGLKVEEEIECQIDFNVTSYIPDEFIQDQNQKIEITFVLLFENKQF